MIPGAATSGTLCGLKLSMICRRTAVLAVLASALACALRIEAPRAAAPDAAGAPMLAQAEGPLPALRPAGDVVVLVHR